MAGAPPKTPGPILQPGFLRRLGIAGCGAALAAYALLAGLTVAGRGGPGPFVALSDLLSNLSGAAILRDGQAPQLYDRATQTAEQAAILAGAGLTLQHTLPFVHLPAEPALLAPLLALGLSYPAVFVLWTLLSLALIAGSLALLWRGWPPGRARGALCVLAAVTFCPLFVSLLLGQSSAIMLFGWAASSFLLRRGRGGRAGAALLIAAVKPQAVLTPLFALLVTRRWRALGGFAGAAAVCLALSLPLLGWDWPLRYARLALSVGGYPPDPTLNPASMPNWRGSLIQLFGDSALVNQAALAAALLSLGVVGALWLGGGADWAPETPRWSRRWAATLLAHQLISPYLLPHDLTLAIVPGWILAADPEFARSRPLQAWLWAGWGLGLLVITNGALAVLPATLWTAATVGLLFWRDRREAAGPTTAHAREEAALV